MLRRAQHLWIRGAPLDIIGRAIGLKEAAVQAYLASLSRAAPLVLAFDPSFRTTVGRALPPALGYYINIELRTSHRGIPWVTVRMFTPSNYEAVVRIVGGGRQERRYFGRCDLFYLGDPLIDAALIWYARMKTRLGSFSACLGTGFCPNENRDNADVSILLDFRPLFSPLIEVLKSRLPVPRPRYSAYRHRVELELGHRIALRHLDGDRSQHDSTEVRLTKREFPHIWRLAKEFNDQRTIDARMRESMILTVSGAHLPDHGEVPGEVFDPIEGGD